MRKLTVIAALIAATAITVLFTWLHDANAQMGRAGGGGPPAGESARGQPPKINGNAPKADEKAYNDALKSIPAKKTDPWDKMR